MKPKTALVPVRCHKCGSLEVYSVEDLEKAARDHAEVRLSFEVAEDGEFDGEARDIGQLEALDEGDKDKAR